MQFVQEIEDLISHDNSPPWDECAAIGGFPQGITQVPETGQQTWRHDARLQGSATKNTQDTARSAAVLKQAMNWPPADLTQSEGMQHPLRRHATGKKHAARRQTRSSSQRQPRHSQVS